MTLTLGHGFHTSSYTLRVAWSRFIFEKYRRNCLAKHFASSRHVVQENQDNETSKTSGRSKRVINTLRPDRIQQTDIIDFSNHITPGIYVEGSHTNMRYSRISHFLSPFPAGTRGFLYYYHQPNLPVTSGEIRFRIVKSDTPLDFEKGTDLPSVRGDPWSIPLSSVILTKYLGVLKTLLIKDGLVPLSEMQRYEKLFTDAKITFTPSCLIHSLKQPFFVDFSNKTLSVKVIGSDRIANATINHLFTDLTNGRIRRPWIGAALVRLELSTLPKHEGTTTLVYRILKIIRPPKYVHPEATSQMIKPTEGSIISSRTPLGRLRPRKVNLNHKGPLAKALRLLVPSYS